MLLVWSLPTTAGDWKHQHQSLYWDTRRYKEAIWWDRIPTTSNYCLMMFCGDVSWIFDCIQATPLPHSAASLPILGELELFQDAEDFPPKSARWRGDASARDSLEFVCTCLHILLIVDEGDPPAFHRWNRTYWSQDAHESPRGSPRGSPRSPRIRGSPDPEDKLLGLDSTLVDLAWSGLMS